MESFLFMSDRIGRSFGLTGLDTQMERELYTLL